MWHREDYIRFVDGISIFALLVAFQLLFLDFPPFNSLSILVKLFSLQASYREVFRKRIPNENMAQIRGTAGYNLGGGMQDRFGGPNRGEATNDPSPLDAIREQTSRIEDWLDTYSDPIKP